MTLTPAAGSVQRQAASSAPAQEYTWTRGITPALERCLTLEASVRWTLPGAGGCHFGRRR